MGKCRREDKDKGTYVSSLCLLIPANRRTLNLMHLAYYDRDHALSPPLMSSIGSATLSKIMYNETNFAIG